MQVKKGEICENFLIGRHSQAYSAYGASVQPQVFASVGGPPVLVEEAVRLISS